MDRKKFIICLIINLLFSIILAIEYDISKGKNINQSKLINGFESRYATDGDLNTYFRVGSISNGKVWFEIDLAGLYNITKVMLWTTNDDEYFLARDIKIYIKYGITYNDKNIIQLSNSANNSISMPQKASLFNYTSSKELFGRYVWIGKDSDDLYIAEIAVLTESSNVGIININEISHNHDYRDYDYDDYYGAAKAIDGDESTCSLTAQDDVSLRNIAGWLKIDLGNNYTIHQMQIYDRDRFENNGFFKVFIDLSTRPTNLCYTYNQSHFQYYQYDKVSCTTSLTGRYVTFVKFGGYRIDLLSFCEIRIFTTHSAKVIIYPLNYSLIFLTTLKPFNKSYPLDCDATISTLKQNQIIIGIVVGLVGVSLGIFLTILTRHFMKKRFSNQNENNVVIYEKPSQIVDSSHVYEDLHNNSIL